MMEELLRILEKNARMPIEDIAAMLDKTPTEVAAMMDEAAAKRRGRIWNPPLREPKRPPCVKGDSPQCGEMSRSDRRARARRAPRSGGGL